jgi:hypothetical protein
MHSRRYNGFFFGFLSSFTMIGRVAGQITTPFTWGPGIASVRSASILRVIISLIGSLDFPKRVPALRYAYNRGSRWNAASAILPDSL